MRRSSIVWFAIVGSVLALTVAVAPVGAQPAFVPGEASASADTIGLKIALGGANIGYTLGRSVSRYQVNEATADGRAIDLEALPTLFGEVGACDGAIPYLPSAALPPETSVESTQAGADQSHRVEAFFPELQKGQSNLSAGFQDARATTQPWGWASTETTTQDIGIFAVEGGRTEVVTQLNGRVREAVAVTRANAVSFLSNTLVLYDVKWEATARSGDVQEVTGSFTFESAKFFGLPRTASQGRADLVWLAGQLQSLLGFLGARLELPKVVVDGNAVTVTPLQFSLNDMPIGQLGISPIVELFRKDLEAYYQQLRDAGCSGQSQAQLYRLVEGIVTGNGSVRLPIGGVSASTDDTDFPALDLGDFEVPEEPVVEEAPAPEPEPVVAPLVTEPIDTSTPMSFDTAPIDDLAFDATEVALAPEPTAPPAAEEPETEVAAPVASRRPPPKGDTGGAAALIGFLGVLAAAGLALADRTSMLRGRRRVIES